MVPGDSEGVRAHCPAPPWGAPTCSGAVRPDAGAGFRGGARRPRGPSGGPWSPGVAILTDPAGRLRLHVPRDPPRCRSHAGPSADRPQGAAAPVSDGAPADRPGPGDAFAAGGAAVVRERSSVQPEIAVVLGSGLRDAVDADVQPDREFSYEALPGFPPSSVPGHAGRLVMGLLHGVPAAVFLGRVHFYEGHGIGSTT